MTKVCTSRGKRIDDDEDADEPKGGRPGPSDQGREGGMATRRTRRRSPLPTTLLSRRTKGLLGVAALPAAPVVGAPKSANHPVSTLTPGGLCSVVSNARPEVVPPGCATRPRQGAGIAAACGLLDFEIDFAAPVLGGDGVQRKARSVDDGGQPGAAASPEAIEALAVLAARLP
jgi:hypothetical protein